MAASATIRLPHDVHAVAGHCPCWSASAYSFACATSWGCAILCGNCWKSPAVAGEGKCSSQILSTVHLLAPSVLAGIWPGPCVFCVRPIFSFPMVVMCRTCSQLQPQQVGCLLCYGRAGVLFVRLTVCPGMTRLINGRDVCLDVPKSAAADMVVLAPDCPAFLD